MIFKKHHTFKYILNRIKQKVFEIKYPNTPWMTPKAIDLLDQLILSDDVGIEYGSGRSTFWFAKRCSHLTSIENNIKWYDLVNKQIAALNNVTYKLCNLNNNPLSSSYYNTITQFEKETIDFIVIDGKYRELIAIEAIKKLKNGGLLIFDNAERYLPNTFKVPESIGNKTSEVSNLIKLFIKETVNWRRIWTSNGISTTLLMFKP